MAVSCVFADQIFSDHVFGVDEAGRGPWAGPLVVGAVKCFDLAVLPKAVNDSKKLSASTRQRVYEELLELEQQEVIRLGVGVVSASVVDAGLSAALTKASRLALEAAGADRGSVVLLDGPVDYIKKYCVFTAPKLDGLEPTVSAASVLAKVTRDNLMVALSGKYPEYGFEKHKGYGSKAHAEAIQKLGPTEAHRLSWSFWKKFPQWSGKIEELAAARKLDNPE